MVQYMFTERAHYVGKVIKRRLDSEGEVSEFFVDFGCFGKKWVKADRCLFVRSA
jgi:hypothetical protein